jgi:hypothetical protein
MHAARLLLAASLALAAAPTFGQGGPDELWNMSTRMEMAGMQVPAQSQQVCMKKGETQPENLGKKDSNCKVTEQSRSGNKFTWKMACTGRDPMTGSGEMTRNRDTLEGRMQMKGKDGEMTISYSGRLSGTCDARTHKDPQMAAAQTQMAAIQAQSDAAIKQACNEAIEKFNTQFFEMQGGPCGPRKSEYCGRVKSTTQSMSTPAGYRSAMKHQGLRDGGWARAGTYCGVATAPTLSTACKSGVGSRDWEFVGEFCPAEAKAIAAQHCAGRDYTAAMESEYKAVCRRYARAGGAGATAQREAPAQQQQQQTQQQQPPAAPAAPSAVDTVKEGANQLRKLFGR